MSRWPLLIACALGPFAAACAPSLTPGLANAPRLGGTAVADEHVQDVVANGSDACRAPSEGTALWSKVPPCPTVERGSRVPPPSATTAPDDAIVIRWIRHFYAARPCDGRTRSSDLEAVAWAPSPATGQCLP